MVTKLRTRKSTKLLHYKITFVHSWLYLLYSSNSTEICSTVSRFYCLKVDKMPNEKKPNNFNNCNLI